MKSIWCRKQCLQVLSVMRISLSVFGSYLVIMTIACSEWTALFNTYFFQLELRTFSHCTSSNVTSLTTLMAVRLKSERKVCRKWADPNVRLGIDCARLPRTTSTTFVFSIKAQQLRAAVDRRREKNTGTPYGHINWMSAAHWNPFAAGQRTTPIWLETHKFARGKATNIASRIRYPAFDIWTSLPI
jgi:hypothetical protein